MPGTEQVTTISVFKFKQYKYWAFKQMRLALTPLSEVKGLLFYKVLGCGAGNGFSILPDFGTYAMLLIWENEAYADQFYDGNPLYLEYLSRSADHQNLYMKAVAGHGNWDGSNPFDFAAEMPGKKMAVLTRATIRGSRLLNFWRYVPRVSRSMEGAPGLQYAIGIGELPLIQQATFSVWESKEAMTNYAYTMARHKEVVKQTRTQKWYREELFTRFQPYRSEGSIPELEIKKIPSQDV